ncbi:MAG: redoxin domain-containing protein [Armatimonadetes bacterium]|nr:redoxin domain-containing protein [Armatimonadota bacterium]
MNQLLPKIIFLATAVAFSCPVFAHADPQVEALLGKMEVVASKTKTLTADFVKSDMFGNTTSGRLRLLKPNYAIISYAKPSPGTAPVYFVSDGTTQWRFPDPAKNEYQVETADPGGSGAVAWLDGLPIQIFFNMAKAFKNAGIETDRLIYDGTKIWEGNSYEILRHEFAEDGKRYTAWLYVGKDYRIHRHVGTFYIPKPDGTPRMFEVRLSNIRVATPDTSKDFVYAPPKVAKEIVNRPLLAPGVVAPDFAVKTPDGKSLRLSDFKGKIVVLDFWATWCIPCIRGMAKTNDIAKRYQDKGVVVLAVAVLDDPSLFKRWVGSHPQYDALLFAVDDSPGGTAIHDKLYNALLIPTQYVVDKNGKIVKSLVGFDGESTELETAVNIALSSP